MLNKRKARMDAKWHGDRYTIQSGKQVPAIKKPISGVYKIAINDVMLRFVLGF